MSVHIAIAGGGPAGLVAAIAARQAGFEVTICEQASGFDKVGGAIGVQSNGLRVLRALGLRDAFDQHIELTKQAGVESPPGRRVSFADFHEIDIPESGFAVALRYDLQSVLLEAAQAHGAEILFGERCKSARDHGSHVALRLASGQNIEADLLFACDGVQSAVRDSLPFQMKRRFVGEAYLRTVAEIEHPDRNRIGELWAPDGRRVGAFPLPGKRTYLFCSVPIGQWGEILSTGFDAWVESWSDFGPMIMQLMQAIDWRNAVYDELSDVRVDRWTRGRVFLLGDAAHAMTPNLGQGANSAMVDALVLVNLLSECLASGGHEKAGERYQQIRKPFVTRTQDAAWYGGKMASWKSAPARALRDGFIKYGTRLSPLRRSSIKLTAGFNPAEDAYIHPPVSTARVTS